jgi:hypothetical protein
MIIILEPIVNKNKIIYPVTILDKLYNFSIDYDNLDPSIKLNNCIDGIVCMLTPVAICNNLIIKSELPIDKMLYDNLIKLPITYKFYHDNRPYIVGEIKKEDIKLELIMPTCDRNKNNTNMVISCISLGVDSIYNVMTKKDHITHLMYICNLDTSSTIENFLYNINFFAKRYHKKLIIVNSNFRQILVSLKLNASGIMFTGDSLQLASMYPLNMNTIIFNGSGTEGSYDYPSLHPQHAHLNKYYNSNEFNTINNDTCRIKKLKYITSNDIFLLNILRVCTSNTVCKTKKVHIGNNSYYKGDINCMKCFKCNITFAYLYMLRNNNIINIIGNKDYLSHFLKNSYDYKKKDHYTTGQKYTIMEFDNIHNLYKNNNLDSLDLYEFIFDKNKGIMKLIS